MTVFLQKTPSFFRLDRFSSSRHPSPRIGGFDPDGADGDSQDARWIDRGIN
jgi:hypothetical protein